MNQRKQHNIEHHIKELYLHDIGNKKKIEENSNKLKKSCDIGIVSTALKSLFHSNSSFEHLIYGYLKPTNIENLGKCNGYYYEPYSFESEMLWQIMQIKCYKKEIQDFINIRQQFEHLFLLGSYTEALDLLENSFEKLGFSVWYLEQKILIYCYQNRANELITWLSDINRKQQDIKTGYVPFLLSYLYKRSQKNMSPIEYDMDLFSRFKRNVTLFDEDKYNYFLMRLNYYVNYLTFNDFSRMLIFESPNSAIDRYCNIINILKAYFVSETGDKNLACKIGNKLYQSFQDNHFLPFLAYSKQKLPDCYFDSHFIHILDLYYEGKYLEAIESCIDYTNNNSCNFDVLKIYCRSLLFLGNTTPKITHNANSPLNDIVGSILKIMNGKDVRVNQDRLYRINKNLYGLSICAGLDEYVKEEKLGIRDNRLKLLSYFHFDPDFTKIFNSDSEKIKYFELFQSKISDSVVISYQKGLVENKVTNNISIVSYIREVDNGKILFKQEKYYDCILLMEKVIANNQNCVPILQSAIEFGFKSHTKLDEEKAIEYYVNYYVKNHAYTSKIDTHNFISKQKRNKYRGIKYSLDLLIFVFENAEEETDKSFVLETYLKYNEVSDVVELIEQIDYDDNKKVEEFLVHIITDDILRHTTFINSTQSILEEERQILSYLTSLDSSRHDEYEEMMQQLSEEMIAYDGAIKDDESKIFANIPSIIKYELENAKQLYSQFCTMYKANDTAVVYMVDSTKPCEDIKDGNHYAYLGQHLHFTDNALKEISFQLFDEIRKQFLKSKFGLGTYLSTRIRHGVFEGELRSVFSGHYLALNMENDEYIPNNIWKTRYRLTDDSNKALIGNLKMFSKSIDQLIKIFKSDILQIRTTKEEKGYFNYILDDDTICWCTIDAYKKSTDFESFSYSIMNYLWELTEHSLSNIRKEIKTILTTKCHALLDELESSVKNNANYNFTNDFKSSVNDARTEVSQRLLKIEGWFHIQDMKFEDYNLEELIKICWDITCKMHPNTQCELEVSCPNTIILAGNTRIHISDLIRIFYSNMTQVSQVNIHSSCDI